jgi:hypothetical protein
MDLKINPPIQINPTNVNNTAHSPDVVIDNKWGQLPVNVIKHIMQQLIDNDSWGKVKRSDISIIARTVARVNRKFQLVYRAHTIKVVLKRIKKGVLKDFIEYCSRFPNLIEFNLNCPKYACGCYFKYYKIETARLRSINERKCKDGCLSGQEFETLFQNFPTIQSLKLQSSSVLRNSTLEFLSTFSHITELNLSQNPRLQNKGIEFLLRFKNLRVLDLSSCDSINEKALNFLSQLSTLTSLRLNHSWAVTDESLAQLAKLKQLRSLEIESRPLERMAGKMIRNPEPELGGRTLIRLPDLKQITDTGIVHLSHLESLEYLSLYGRIMISDQGIAALSELKQLTRLDIGECRALTNNIVTSLVHMTSLTSIIQNASNHPLNEDGKFFLQHNLPNFKLFCPKPLPPPLPSLSDFSPPSLSNALNLG